MYGLAPGRLGGGPLQPHLHYQQHPPLLRGGVLLFSAARAAVPPVVLGPGRHPVQLDLDTTGVGNRLEWTRTRPTGVHEIVPSVRLRHRGRSPVPPSLDGGIGRRNGPHWTAQCGCNQSTSHKKCQNGACAGSTQPAQQAARPQQARLDVAVTIAVPHAGLEVPACPLPAHPGRRLGQAIAMPQPDGERSGRVLFSCV